jgi:hypothetical protein
MTQCAGINGSVHEQAVMTAARTSVTMDIPSSKTFQHRSMFPLRLEILKGEVQWPSHQKGHTSVK